MATPDITTFGLYRLFPKVQIHYPVSCLGYVDIFPDHADNFAFLRFKRNFISAFFARQLDIRHIPAISSGPEGVSISGDHCTHKRFVIYRLPPHVAAAVLTARSTCAEVPRVQSCHASKNNLNCRHL